MAVSKIITGGNLTAQQIRFAEEYIIDLNARKAAQRAGYGKRMSGRGTPLINHPEIRKLIQRKLDDRSTRTQITADSVLSTISNTVDALVADDPIKNAGMIFKGAELLGKHLKLFTDRLELSGHITLEALVAKSTRDIVEIKE